MSQLFAPPNYPAKLYDPGNPHINQNIKTVPLHGPKTQTQDPIVTGTSVLGIKYKDGVMLASDTLLSYGSMARFKDINRIIKVGKYTLIGGTGEYSDFQYIEDLLDEMTTEEYCLDDGATLNPKEIYNYLTRVMYNRRNKFDPLYNQLVIAGFRDGKSFLGQVDLVGTQFEDDTIGTGYGGYIARPLLRNAYRNDLTAQEAKVILEDCMRVLYYRDARSINRIQIASASADGVVISKPYELETDWEHGHNVSH